MPSAAVVHAACFAIGAVVGGGIVTAVGASQRKPIPPASPTTPTASTTQTPIVKVSKSGLARIVSQGQIDLPPLKYGNPGKSIISIIVNPETYLT